MVPSRPAFMEGVPVSIFNVKSITINYDGGLSGTAYIRRARSLGNPLTIPETWSYKTATGPPFLQYPVGTQQGDLILVAVSVRGIWNTYASWDAGAGYTKIAEKTGQNLKALWYGYAPSTTSGNMGLPDIEADNAYSRTCLSLRIPAGEIISSSSTEYELQPQVSLQESNTTQGLALGVFVMHSPTTDFGGVSENGRERIAFREGDAGTAIFAMDANGEDADFIVSDSTASVDDIEGLGVALFIGDI